MRKCRAACCPKCSCSLLDSITHILPSTSTPPPSAPTSLIANLNHLHNPTAPPLPLVLNPADFSWPYSVPSVAGDVAYFVTGFASNLFAVDLTTGGIAWRRKLLNYAFAQPVVSGGRLFVGDWGVQEPKLYAFGL